MFMGVSLEKIDYQSLEEKKITTLSPYPVQLVSVHWTNQTDQNSVVMPLTDRLAVKQVRVCMALAGPWFVQPTYPSHWYGAVLPRFQQVCRFVTAKCCTTSPP